MNDIMKVNQMIILDASDRALLDSVRNILTTGVLSYKLHIDLLDKLEASTIEANRKSDDEEFFELRFTKSYSREIHDW